MTTTARRPGRPAHAMMPLPTGRRAIGWAAAAGTVPYVALKIAWLAGSTVGVKDPGFLADPSIVVLNAVTLLLDLAVVALAMALTRPWGRRLPASLVLLPVWVGSGLLLPLVVTALPVAVLSVVVSAVPSEPGGVENPLQLWVQPVVYSGFAVQGVCLLLAFVRYALDRWPGVVAAAPVAPRGPALDRLLRVLVRGGTATATASAGLHLVTGALDGRAAAIVMAVGSAGLAAAGAIGVSQLANHTTRPWPATVAAWVGSSAMFAWGLWTTAIGIAGTALPPEAPTAALAHVTGLLGGFALAVAGLLVLTAAGVAADGAGANRP